jgi:hypothetical protein
MTDLLIALGLFALLMVSLEAGYWGGRRATGDVDARSSGQIGAIQGAILGLLGLLLAFSFASAASRFLERQDLIVQEANAIGTAYLRADLVEEPHRTELREALKQYTASRISVGERLRMGIQSADLAEASRLQSQMWHAATKGVAGNPLMAYSVLPPVNDIIDLNSTRIAAAIKQLPVLVIALLIACSALSVGVIGYGTGMSGRRRLSLTLPLVIVVGTSLWIIIDLDHPRSGLMQLSDEPLRSITFE